MLYFVMFKSIPHYIAQASSKFEILFGAGNFRMILMMNTQSKFP